jgi:hypothetical protein
MSTVEFSSFFRGIPPKNEFFCVASQKINYFEIGQSSPASKSQRGPIQSKGNDHDLLIMCWLIFL